MGQYYRIINIDKRQFIDPMKFNDGSKLMEILSSQFGVLSALTILLADGNGRGGGDVTDGNHPLSNIIGSWAGNKIVIGGDYADGNKFVTEKTETLQKIADEVFTEGNQKAEDVTLYHVAEYLFEDITKKVIQIMLMNDYVKTEMELNKSITTNITGLDIRWNKVNMIWEQNK